MPPRRPGLPAPHDGSSSFVVESGKAPSASCTSFKQQMVALVRAGRGPEELAREFPSSAKSVRDWVRQADPDQGRRSDGLTSGEREEHQRLRQEVRPDRGNPGKSRGLVRSGDSIDPTEGYRFVRANQAEYAVKTQCRVLELSRIGYYEWVCWRAVPASPRGRQAHRADPGRP